MNYAATLQYLEEVQSRGIKLGLENVTRLLAEMGDPQEAFPAVVVAGTNGKGSVCAMLASILKTAGIRAGLYTSPHLIKYEERIAVDGSPITRDEFAGAIATVRSHVAALVEKDGPASHPTHFEILTAAAFHHFREKRVDVGILEVGMGGRLDAVSVTRTAVAILTNVGLEHTQFLGDTLEAIAAEKAGVLKRGCRAITAERDHAPLKVIRDRASRMKVHLVEARRDTELTRLSRVGPPGRFGLVTPAGRYDQLELAMAGRHQVENAVVAVLAAEALAEAGFGITRDAIAGGLARAHWPGRLQVVGRDPLVILDGAHNPAGSQALARSLRDLLGEGGHRRLGLVVGLLRDKDLRGVLEPLLSLAESVVVTRGRSERFRGAEEIAAVVRDLGCEPTLAADVTEALQKARAWALSADVVCLCGSLYLVGEAMEALGLEPFA